MSTIVQVHSKLVCSSNGITITNRNNEKNGTFFCCCWIGSRLIRFVTCNCLFQNVYVLLVIQTGCGCWRWQMHSTLTLCLLAFSFRSAKWMYGIFIEFKIKMNNIDCATQMWFSFFCILSLTLPGFTRSHFFLFWYFDVVLMQQTVLLFL